MDLSEAIRAQLADRGGTQHALAEAVGLSRQGLSNKMNGHTDFTMAEIGRIADYFGITATTLVAHAEDTAALAEAAVGAPTAPLTPTALAAPSEEVA